jgi:hypothetical protein
VLARSQVGRPDRPARITLTITRLAILYTLSPTSTDHGYTLQLHTLQWPRHVMAPTKRKRTSTRSESTNKRPRYSVPSDSEPTSSPQEWKAGCILEERLVGRKRQYLIKWTDIDPSTGRVYPPTWEPKENANALLIASWAQEQASGGAQGPRREQPKKTPRPPRATRRSRIVESSPEPSNDSSRTLSRLTTPARDTTHVQSSTVTTPTAAPSTRTCPCIRIRPRGRSLDRDEYKRYPQPATSQPASSQSLIQDTDLDSSALFAAAPEYRALGIVPDSQSSEGEGNFVPATQQTTGTTEPSSALEVSQEDATQDSVRLVFVILQSSVRGRIGRIGLGCQLFTREMRLLMETCRASPTSCKNPPHAHRRLHARYQRLSTTPQPSPRVSAAARTLRCL